MTLEEEQAVWTGSPAQILNFFNYLLCLILAVICIGIVVKFPAAPFWIAPAGILIALIVGLWRYYGTKTTVYRLTSQRLISEKGILNRREDSLELYRVKDCQIYKPLFLRIFHLGNITLLTSDETTPVFLMHGIPEVNRVQDMIRNHSEERRRVTHTRDLGISNA